MHFPSSRIGFSIGLVLAVGCGGQTVSNGGDAGGDAGADADSGPISVCHGYCPQPNGSPCSSDCDCDNKCLGGTDKPATCANPIAPNIACSDAAACPSGQTCGPFGSCEGATCGTTDDCPPQQQCVSSTCKAFGCL